MKNRTNTKLLVLCVLILLIAIKANSTILSIKKEISGFVKDSISGEGLPFATVQVLRLHDSVLIKGATTDFDGKYVISNIKTGDYTVKASYMGYTEKEKTLIVKANQTKCDFSLVQKSISLSEISITAEKNLIEKNLEKTTVNVSKNTTVTAGTAIDVMQTLPSVDIDIDGNINYRGSNKVKILINGEKTELIKSLDQIPADQIEKVELINNPSAKHEAEGMSGIINIVLKSGKTENNKARLMILAGYPETIGGNAGYNGMGKKISFFINGGIKHNTKYQIKEHLRENYGNPNSLNYYQYDRKDENFNDAFINTSLDYKITKNQELGISFIGSKKFNDANRTINYKTLSKTEQITHESVKEINIDLNNYTIDGTINYRCNFKKNRFLSSNIHHSLFNQTQEANNTFYSELQNDNQELQNTFLQQLNKQTDISIDYVHPHSDSLNFEIGYDLNSKDLLNDFKSETQVNLDVWHNDTAMTKIFTYVQTLHATYFNLTAKLKFLELQAGVRSEYTSNIQSNTNTDDYIDIFPSISISHKLNNYFTLYASYNRRINRPTIKMLNPFSDEYSDLLNMHKGNPNLKPEYVNSVEIGNRFAYNKFSGLMSIYYRDIDQAISRIKSASNDSALFVSFINLDNAKLTGGEISLSYNPFVWWNISSNSNVFYTNLSGKYGNNYVDNSKIGWNFSLLLNFKLPKDFGFQLSAYYRSKLPSVIGIYKERYYFDLALNKKILKNKAQIIFKVSDIFNTYIFGLDLDAIDNNDFRYSQINRRKKESRYFIISFIYNISGKEQKHKKESFFLDDFDK
ncbi:MAG: TonB-dependent receptor [Bacteroidales bacterium]|nr:TonB-dependent receptor [Bacteroidales bacterium]